MKLKVQGVEVRAGERLPARQSASGPTEDGITASPGAPQAAGSWSWVLGHHGQLAPDPGCLALSMKMGVTAPLVVPAPLVDGYGLARLPCLVQKGLQVPGSGEVMRQSVSLPGALQASVDSPAPQARFTPSVPSCVSLARRLELMGTVQGWGESRCVRFSQG